MNIRQLLVVLGATFLGVGAANAQNRYFREESAPASATSARFSALWLPDTTVTLLVALEDDRADGTAAYRAIYRIDCVTNTPLSVEYEAFNAGGVSLGLVDAAPEDLTVSFERLAWERPCARNDIPPGVAIDPPPMPSVLFDARPFPPGLVQSVAEAITFTRSRETAYEDARQLSLSGHWRRIDGLSTSGTVYAERGPIDGGRRRIELVFVPDDPSDQAFAHARYAYERISYSVACRSTLARVIYRLRASDENELVSHQGSGPEVPFSSLAHRETLSRACIATGGDEFNSIGDALRDARARNR